MSKQANKWTSWSNCLINSLQHQHRVSVHIFTHEHLAELHYQGQTQEPDILTDLHSGSGSGCMTTHISHVCVSTVVTLQGLFPRITLGKRRDYLFLPVPLGWNSVSLALISVCKIVFCCWEKSQEWCILLSAVSGHMWGPSVLPLPETLVIWLRWCFLRFLYDRVSILSSWKPRSIFRDVFWEMNFLFLFEVHLLSLAFYV